MRLSVQKRMINDFPSALTRQPIALNEFINQTENEKKRCETEAALPSFIGDGHDVRSWFGSHLQDSGRRAGR
jgi:hypothetical protein